MSGPRHEVFDAGLQAERTALAWRRTSLAMAVAAVGGARLAAPTIGVAAVALGVAGLLQATLVAANARARYRLVFRSLTGRGDLSAMRRPGLPLAALTCSCMLVGALALAFVLGD